jgi:hypothetical protein
VLRCVPVARDLCREDVLFPGLRPCLQVKTPCVFPVIGFCSF